jgi:phosphoribosylglycinamide formyltransferase 1
MVRLAILIGPRGRGSNMRAIAVACARGEVPAEVCLVVAPNEGIPAVEIARQLELPVAIVPPSDTYAEALIEVLETARADWICLAGYTRLLPGEILQRWPGRVLNIHPALLPKYGGKGMYGQKVHEAVIAAGDPESGCTVHFVTERYDEGEIVHQLRCPVLPEDTAEALAARVLALEHRAYPEALKRLLESDGF